MTACFMPNFAANASSKRADVLAHREAAAGDDALDGVELFVAPGWCWRGRRTCQASTHGVARGGGDARGVGIVELLERVARRRRDVRQPDARDRRLQIA